MKRIIALTILLTSAALNAQEWVPSEWPILKHYDSEHLYNIALPLGGIGTGTVSLGGRGELRDWQIMNVPAIGFCTFATGNNAPFFSIYTKEEKNQPKSRMLAGPIYPYEYNHFFGTPVNHHGLPRFSEASFDAAYPFGQVNLSDRDLPVSVRIKGFNPLVPADEEASGLPVAVLSYEVTNDSNAPVEVAVCGSMRNFIGKDGSRYFLDWKGEAFPEGSDQNRNEIRISDIISGIYMYSDGVSKDDPAWGNISLSTISKGIISARTYSVCPAAAEGDILSFWDDFTDDGVIADPEDKLGQHEGQSDPMASVCVKKTLAAGETQLFTFMITWNFPNRRAWSQTVVGNWYSTKYPDSWESAVLIANQLPELEKRTLNFVNALLGSTYPDYVKEAALFNLSALRSQTAFRLPSGHLCGWEGTSDTAGLCEGTCTHVWNYEQATAFLFGKLARTMRDVEFNYALSDNGAMDFRANLPLGSSHDEQQSAADGQLGCIMKIYRDWQFSGDNEFLKAFWPQVKKALAFAWIEHGWDGNCDGVMEGSQHNTMDVNYFGPNPQMSFWYLGALRAAEEMAKSVKDKEFEIKCRRLFDRGSRWVDANLFNGEYYEHKITDPESFEFIPEDQTEVPPSQLGKGCLVDQLVGQYMAHICGLGYLGNPQHIKTTLQSVLKYNFKDPLHAHFNNMRSFIFEGESGLLMASWPKGRLAVPFPYFAECMTGFEYSTAAGMIYEGMTEEGLKCIKAVRDRFDGTKRNPFDEPECGHHYARSMASWAAVPALSGFLYSGVDKTMNFTSNAGRYFWSNGYSWGTCEVAENYVALQVIEGSLELDKLTLTGLDKPLAKKIRLSAGECTKQLIKL